MKKQIIPSLLSADFAELGEEIKRIEKAGIKHLHLDVMDGHFVPNISFGPGVIQKIRSRTDLFFDCHLMVEEPDFLLEKLRDAGCDLVTVQQEGVRHLDRMLTRIHSLGMKAGVSLNPSTPLSSLQYVIGKMDLLLIMTVNPGFGGQSFLPEGLTKIRDARAFLDANNASCILEADGGIKQENLKDVMGAGLNWAVCGSAVFESGKTYENALALRKIAEGIS